jgi:DNA repair protein RadD
MSAGDSFPGVCMMLRPYQERAITDLRTQYASGKRAPCLVLPTGAGKTVIAASVIRSAVARNKRVLFLVHRTELQSQSVAKLEHAGVTDLRIIKAGQDIGSRQAPVTVASIPTLTRWDTLPDADLVVFDECHHVVAKTWARIATAYAKSHLLGMTATPQRADGKPLGDIFDSIVVGATVGELTELGHLVPCRVWAPSTLPESGEIAFDPAEAYRLHANGKRAVIFCVTVEHAETVAASMPVPTRVVHGEMSARDRSAALEDFAAGRVLALANVHVLTEGFDCPAAAVCILTRKPEHAGTFLQMVGRVLRPSPCKSEALLLDLGGSVWQHGTPDAERNYTLDGEGIERANDDRESIRQCATCGGVFLAAKVIEGCCPQCGVKLPYKPVKPPRSNGAGIAEVAGNVVTPADVLRTNLQRVARRTRRSMEWVERAHGAINSRRFGWR